MASDVEYSCVLRWRRCHEVTKVDSPFTLHPSPFTLHGVVKP
jgi:hypothetical protein